jgi:membrane protein DedA with SNARE-associated domain
MNTVQLIIEFEKFYLNYGYPVIFLSSLIEISPLGWTIPGGLILAGGGFYAFGGRISLLGVFISGWLGGWFSFVTAYLLGNKTGLLLVRKLKQEKNARRAKLILKRHGASILTTSMMANLTRFWIAYIAGLQKYSFLKFMFYSGVASLTWSSLMIVVGYLAGSKRQGLEAGLASIGILAWILVFLALGIIYWKTKKEFKQFKEEDK